MKEEYDLRILQILKDDSKQDILSVADKLDLKASTTYRKIRKLDKDVIIKNTVMINHSKIGYKHNAIISIKVVPDEKELLGDFLFRYKGINNLYISGNCESDFVFETIHKNKSQFDDFIKLIKEVFTVGKIKIFSQLERLRGEDLQLI